MRLIFLGAGSAFTVGNDNFHSNLLLEDNQKNRFLIDCGSDVRWSLDALGYTHRDITDVFISHMHADHAGGLEWLGFKTKFDPGVKSKPRLHVSDQLAGRLWNSVLCGGLQSLETEVADLTTYFDVEAVDSRMTFQWQSVEFRLVPTEHVFNGDQWVPSFGLFFKVNDKHYFFTADMQFKPEKYLEYYTKADVIFHECETTPFPSGVHCSFNQLLTLDPAIKAKMWLYHYNPGELPDAKSGGFQGFVKRGQSFQL